MNHQTQSKSGRASQKPVHGTAFPRLGMIFSMSLSAILSMVAAGMGLLGSAILAFSLDSILRVLRTAWLAHEVTLEQLLSTGDIPHFTGMEKQLERSERTAARRTTVELVLLSLAFGLQLWAIVIAVQDAPTRVPKTKQMP